MSTSEKIEVEICAGTTCYVMGSSEIIMSIENYEGDLLDHFEMRGSPCLGMCRKVELGNVKPPFIKINGEVYSSVTADSFWKILEEKARDGK